VLKTLQIYVWSGLNFPVSTKGKTREILNKMSTKLVFVFSLSFFFSTSMDTLMTYLDKIQDPLLVFHGATDPRVPVEEAIQIYNKMKNRGIEGGLIIFPEEGHGVRKRKNRAVYISRTLSFFLIWKPLLSQNLIILRHISRTIGAMSYFFQSVSEVSSLVKMDFFS